ncbi:MAG: hypothetical protein IJL15_06475 [Clostridia bacterium]|nr:hypothetical protein [Clostridia bacterium]
MKFWKNLLFFALLSAMLFSICGCLSKQGEKTPTSYATLGELSEAVGYSVNTPMYIPGKDYTETYTDLGEGVAEIVYQNSGQTIVFTMVNQPNQDLLGDLSEYPEEYESTCRGYSIPLYGKDGVAYVSQWSENNKTFAMRFTVGVTPELFDEIIMGV